MLRNAEYRISDIPALEQKNYIISYFRPIPFPAHRSPVVPERAELLRGFLRLGTEPGRPNPIERRPRTGTIREIATVIP